MMEENTSFDLRPQHKTSAFVSGVEAFAWRSEGNPDYGVLIVESTKEAEEYEDAYTKTRVEPVSEREAEDLLCALDNPYRFHETATILLADREVIPADEQKR